MYSCGTMLVLFILKSVCRFLFQTHTLLNKQLYGAGIFLNCRENSASQYFDFSYETRAFIAIFTKASYYLS
jgi:hypothetical protein